MPPAFQTAIFVCRYLEIPHLWIDSLCIEQDNKFDWDGEMPKMAYYYNNAYLTISLSSSPNSTHSSLPRPPKAGRVLPLLQPYSFVSVQKVPSHFAMSSTRFCIKTSDALPLFSRAWALQERLLARRVLHFGPEELVWECCSLLDCECHKPPDA
ncbi:uncharacterized protein BDZ99DRAFT_540174, partial [Mytilinidion resinicola]